MTYLTKPGPAGIYRLRLCPVPDPELPVDPLYMTANFTHAGHEWAEGKMLDGASKEQQWVIVPLGNDSYSISCVSRNAGMVKNSDEYQQYPYASPRPNTPSEPWKIKEKTEGSVTFSVITHSNEESPLQTLMKIAVMTGSYHSDAYNMRWVFEFVGQPPGSFKTYQSSFFTLTLEEAKTYEYDIIIVGTGIGGGVLAGDLFDTNVMVGENAKSVLVIEKGGLTFHSHCLNAARPAGRATDRSGQQNDAFFTEFKEDYAFSEYTDLEDWNGGPMYNLGGRSAAWGLFVPRIHDRNLHKWFPKSVHRDLLSTYYREAETLMELSLPTTRTIHQDLMERLNATTSKDDVDVQWQWGRIASEFQDRRNFDFARGAYSTIDKLLEIAMSKPLKDGKPVEHEYFKILLEAEVRSLVWDSITTNQVAGVCVRIPGGFEDVIPLKKGGQVILSAGSVGSAAILLRSNVDLASKGGLHLTDHDIFFKSLSFRYRQPGSRARVGSMKVQTYVEMEEEGSDTGSEAEAQVAVDDDSGAENEVEVVLANMSIDASTFLPRGCVTFDANPKCISTFIRSTPLNSANTIELDDCGEPVVTINREKPFSYQDPIIKRLQNWTEEAMQTISDVLGVVFLAENGRDLDTASLSSIFADKDFFQVLPLGGVAHELGTIPMKQRDDSKPFCVDETLKLDGYEGVYVCDLSVLPFSPEVNPSVTLAALSLRLSRTVLLPRDVVYMNNAPLQDLDPDTVYVVNHTGQQIKVWVANKAGVYITGGNVEKILDPGETYDAARSRYISEAVYVYRRDVGTPDQFVPEPRLVMARPGEVTPVVFPNHGGDA